MRARTWLIFSRVPPPIGGVTIYAKRFGERRRAKGDIVWYGFPVSWRSTITLLRHASRLPKYVLINSLSLTALLLAFILFPFSARIVVDHNHSRKLTNRFTHGANWPLQVQLSLTRFLLERMDRVWLVSDHLRSFYRGFKVRVRTVRPFIPPTPSEYGPAIEAYSPELKSLLAAERRPTLFAISAYKLVTENGEDLYGFTRALDALESFIKRNLDIRLIMFVADPEPTDLYCRIRERIQAPDVAPNVLWEEGQKPLWPLFRHVDAFLRPTVTDGWSISVEEALSMGCPVIASNVVPRPPACELFSLESPEGFERAMMKVEVQHRTVSSDSGVP